MHHLGSFPSTATDLLPLSQQTELTRRLAHLLVDAGQPVPRWGHIVLNPFITFYSLEEDGDLCHEALIKLQFYCAHKTNKLEK